MIAPDKEPVTPGNKKTANAAIRSAEWKSINWDYHGMIVKKLQMRIAKATQLRKFKKVKQLQWILMHFFSAKLLAVRKVMQNKGSKTPGVDGIIIKTPAEKMALATNMKRRGYQSSPLRRIYIPKAGNKNKLRPLSIPTIADRCCRALHNLALVPVSEVLADQNSYGFRPQRCCADAIGQSFIVLAKRISPQCIPEGDIKGCFDHISHEWISSNICMDKVILNKWLKAGFIETGKLFPTTEGTPQGGIISPVILRKYYSKIKTVTHCFSGQEKRGHGTCTTHTLLKMAYTPIRRHVKILQPAHPWDAKYDEYFEKRTSDKWKNNSHKHYVERKIYMLQEGKCPCCLKALNVQQNWCISLRKKASKGGEYKSGNIDIIHNKCYEMWQTKRSAYVKPATNKNGGFKRA